MSRGVGALVWRRPVPDGKIGAPRDRNTGSGLGRSARPRSPSATPRSADVSGGARRRSVRRSASAGRPRRCRRHRSVATPGSAPADRNSSTSSSSPCWAAACSGVKSCCWRGIHVGAGRDEQPADLVVAARRRRCGAAGRASRCRDTASTMAPASMSVRAASALPKKAAKWSAVNPSADKATARPGSSSSRSRKPVDVAERRRLEDVEVRVGRQEGVRRAAIEPVAGQHDHRHAVAIARGREGRILGHELRHPGRVVGRDGGDHVLCASPSGRPSGPHRPTRRAGPLTAAAGSRRGGRAAPRRAKARTAVPAEASPGSGPRPISGTGPPPRATRSDQLAGGRRTPSMM